MKVIKILSHILGSIASTIFIYIALTYNDVRTTEYDIKYNMIGAYAISYIYSKPKKEDYGEEN